MHLDTFLFSALLLLLATSVAVALFKHLGLGSVLGLLVAGIVVGPYSPGPYVTEHVEDVRHFTELGVVLLLFLIGLEMKPGRLWAMRREGDLVTRRAEESLREAAGNRPPLFRKDGE